MAALPKTYHCSTLVYTTRALAVLFFWLIWGDFCFMLMESVVPSLMPLKLKALNAPNMTVGLVMVTIPQAINMVFNPIISFRSDRYRSRWGRRIPFILLSIPFIVFSLLGLGFGDDLGMVIYRVLRPMVEGLTPNLVILSVFGLMMVLFSFFNTFVNSTFWYLFNDVVPETLLARFMSWFRVMSLLSSSLYSFFVFPYAATHFREIFVGAALIYLLGFGLMCLNVKEGDYPAPPPNVNGRLGFIPAIKTFVKECFAQKHYWWMFLGNMFYAASLTSAAGSVLPFMLYFYQGTGLSLTQIGRVQAGINITAAVFMLGAGWLADRYHPIRVVMAGQIMQLAIVLPVSCIWLFWHPTPSVAFVAWMCIALLLTAPAAALIAVLDPPLLMRIFPRELYGQFCSANAICKSIGCVAGGILTGLFFDGLSRAGTFTNVYAFMPVWQIVCTVPVVFYTIKLYRSWKAHGGDSSYEAPLDRFDAGTQNAEVAKPAL